MVLNNRTQRRLPTIGIRGPSTGRLNYVGSFRLQARALRPIVPGLASRGVTPREQHVERLPVQNPGSVILLSEASRERIGTATQDKLSGRPPLRATRENQRKAR